MLTRLQAEYQYQKISHGQQIHGVVGSSISWLPLRPHTPNLVWRFLRHIGTFLDNLWGVDTKAGRVSVPTTGPSSSNTWGVRSSISQLPSKASCTKLFLEVPATHGNISRPLARCWHTCRQSTSALNWAELRKCMGQWGCQYLRFYWGPMHQIFLEASETHRNITRLHEKCWHTSRHIVSTQNSAE